MATLSINNDEMLKALDSKLDELVDQVFADSQQIIISKKIIDEGTLLKSGNIKRQFLNKEIVYSVPYAESIEYGRTPGTFPPIAPLIAWVKRKGIAKGNKAKSIAFAIARDIKVNGQEPRPFLEPAINKAKSQLK